MKNTVTYIRFPGTYIKISTTRIAIGNKVIVICNQPIVGRTIIFMFGHTLQYG